MRKHDVNNGNGHGAVALAPPPLQAGDRLTRAEFLERWEAMPQLKRAELIGGIVYMPSPVSRHHGRWENCAIAVNVILRFAPCGKRCRHWLAEAGRIGPQG